MKGGAKVAIEAHRHEGIFIARGKEDALVGPVVHLVVAQCQHPDNAFICGPRQCTWTDPQQPRGFGINAPLTACR